MYWSASLTSNKNIKELIKRIFRNWYRKTMFVKRQRIKVSNFYYWLHINLSLWTTVHVPVPENVSSMATISLSQKSVMKNFGFHSHPSGLSGALSIQFLMVWRPCTIKSLVWFWTTNSATTLKPTFVFTARKNRGNAYFVVL